MLQDPLNTYPAVFRQIGGRQALRNPVIPDADLCIGDAEFLANAPIVYDYKPGGQNLKAMVPPVETQDDLLAQNAGKPIKLSDFPVDYYFGEVS
jgi:ferredoxin